jgi:hypothetical protein
LEVADLPSFEERFFGVARQYRDLPWPETNSLRSSSPAGGWGDHRERKAPLAAIQPSSSDGSKADQARQNVSDSLSRRTNVPR